MSEIKNVGYTWMAKCNQLTPLPFKWLNARETTYIDCCLLLLALSFCFMCITTFMFRCQIASPACTELEMVVMDWLAKLLELPKDFLSTGKGGGVIQVYIRVLEVPKLYT